ncbi:MAG: alpha/beta fold hydrolase [SAR202 cluster bacterium]|nr:alpha/beta fold hydrolase [SAR202 cluster bacterium]
MATTAPQPTWTTEYIPGDPRIAVDKQGSGPLLVMMHGIGGHRSNWHDQLPEFAPHFTVVAWDARGYGNSGDYDGELDPRDFSKDLLRLLDHYGAKKAHIMGLSMGGMIAQDFYSMHPERVATLVLCDTSDGLSRSRTPAEIEEFVRLRTAPLLAGKEPKDMAPAVADTLIGRKSSRESWQRLVDSMSMLHKEMYIKTVRANTKRSEYPDASNIQVPTLLVFGEDDRLTTPEVGRKMHAKIKGSESLLIPTAGHLSNIEQPVFFNEHVLGWLLQRRALAL